MSIVFNERVGYGSSLSSGLSIHPMNYSEYPVTENQMN